VRKTLLQQPQNILDVRDVVDGFHRHRRCRNGSKLVQTV
jgi:hypothetical protein